MIRPFAIALLLAIAPLAPAAAVVTVAITAAEIPPPARKPQPAAKGDLLDLSFGEIAAALAGLAIIGVVMFGGRQPPSVTA